MIPFVEDKFHFARQSSVFFVVFEDNVLEVHFYLYGYFGLYVAYRTALEAATQEFHMCFIQKFSFEGIAGAFFLHYVDVEGLYQ